MESDLGPDPSDTANALLTQLLQIGLGNFSEAGSTPEDPASTWSSTTSAVRIQMTAIGCSDDDSSERVDVDSAGP
jgi:hypothetical protein